MSYSEFTFHDLKEKLSLDIVQTESLFDTVEEVQVSEYLSMTLKENVALALNINTEKARSEMIIAPILIEIRKILKRKISLFSGIEFNVDSSLGLNGVCDYIITNSTNQLYIQSPEITIVESKNENIKSGLPQCIAEMYAARIYNEKEKDDIHRILGIVTTGSNWKFLKLEDKNVYIDYEEYLISSAGKILAIIINFIQETMHEK